MNGVLLLAAVIATACVQGAEDVIPVPQFGEQVTCHVDIACPGKPEDKADRSSCADSLEEAQDTIFATCSDCYCVVVCERTGWFPCIEEN